MRVSGAARRCEESASRASRHTPYLSVTRVTLPSGPSGPSASGRLYTKMPVWGAAEGQIQLQEEYHDN